MLLLDRDTKVSISFRVPRAFPEISLGRPLSPTKSDIGCFNWSHFLSPASHQESRPPRLSGLSLVHGPVFHQNTGKQLSREYLLSRHTIYSGTHWNKLNRSSSGFYMVRSSTCDLACPSQGQDGNEQCLGFDIFSVAFSMKLVHAWNYH